MKIKGEGVIYCMNKKLIKQSNEGNVQSTKEYRWHYVDKTLFIKELLEEHSKVSLILRPRGFGLTTNMIMLKHFLDCRENNVTLFNSLNISKYPNCMKYRGQYVVIYVSLNNELKNIVRELCHNYLYLAKAGGLTRNEEYIFNTIIEGYDRIFPNRTSIFLRSLRKLCDILYRHYERGIVLLIDDYDALFQSYFADKEYDYSYYEVMKDISIWLTNGLNSPYLGFAVLAGNFEISRKGFLNYIKGLKVYGVLDEKFSPYFGFSDDEVRTLLLHYGCLDKYETLQSWYGGYKFTQSKVYNPLSVFSFISFTQDESNDKSILHGANSFSSEYLQEVFEYNEDRMTKDMIRLLSGKSIDAPLYLETIGKHDVNKGLAAIYGLLVQSGYLIVNGNSKFSGYYCLSIPNQETMIILKREVGKYLIDRYHFYELRDMYVSLIGGSWTSFIQSLFELIVHNFNHSDSFYSSCYSLILCLSCGLDAVEVKHECRRDLKCFNIMIISNLIMHSIILMNFKHSSNINEMENDAMLAAEEARNKLYSMKLGQMDFVVSCGISLCDEKVYISPYEVKSKKQCEYQNEPAYTED